jgi:hypothetical protein
VSRFGVMFFDDPHAAFANLARAVRSGGRLAFACWQELLANEWLMVPAGAALAHVPMRDLGEPGEPGPFSLSDPNSVRSILEGTGLAEVGVEDFGARCRWGPRSRTRSRSRCGVGRRARGVGALHRTGWRCSQRCRVDRDRHRVRLTRRLTTRRAARPPGWPRRGAAGRPRDWPSSPPERSGGGAGRRGRARPSGARR